MLNCIFICVTILQVPPRVEIIITLSQAWDPRPCCGSKFKTFGVQLFGFWRWRDLSVFLAANVLLGAHCPTLSDPLSRTRSDHCHSVLWPTLPHTDNFEWQRIFEVDRLQSFNKWDDVVVEETDKLPQFHHNLLHAASLSLGSVHHYEVSIWLSNDK